MAVKVVSDVHIAVDALEKDGVHDGSDVHHQYALRATLFHAVSYGLEEFKKRYNDHNVPGARGVCVRDTLAPRWYLSFTCPSTGGVPRVRRDRRTRPDDAPPPNIVDASVDWPARYVQSTGVAYHGEEHFVQAYTEEVIRGMGAQVALLPSREQAWKDVKNHGGKRNEFLATYALALATSRARASADSIVEAQNDCMRKRGSRCVSEDQKGD